LYLLFCVFAGTGLDHKNNYVSKSFEPKLVNALFV
jgi:hypothetical protein